MKTRIFAALAIGGATFGLKAQLALPVTAGGGLPSEIHLPGCTCAAHGGGVFNRTLVYGGAATLDRPLPGQGAVTQSGFTIQINAGPGLAANAQALAAMNAAAAAWEALLTDPVTVILDVDFGTLAGDVIGSALSSFVSPDAGYGAVRGQMISDNFGSLTQDVTDAIPASLSAFVPSGVTTSPVMTKANAKALGFTVPSGADATITFNSGFAFDFDPSDGIGAGLTDFTSVALHEIGHSLGFVSVVDAIDSGGTTVGFFPLDIFRFGPAPGHNPGTTTEFGSMTRDWRPNVAAYTDIINPARGSGPEYLMSTGRLTGDGRQASHWKDNDLSGTLLGVMDPTLGPGQSFTITAADLNIFDVIGWNVVPEPGEYAAAFGVAALGFAVWRRRARRA